MEETVKEKKKTNILAIILLVLLLCSLGYIGYDKFINNSSKCKSDKTVKKEEKTEEGTAVNDCIPNSEVVSVSYNKDGLFIKNLMSGIVTNTGYDHEEYQLYLKDKVTINDLKDNYKAKLIVDRINGNGYGRYYSTDTIANTSVMLFGKNIFSNYPDKITVNSCMWLEKEGNYYVGKVPEDGGCGGAGYKYLSKITKIASDEKHIFVYQKVGFQCDEKICKNVKAIDGGYEGYDEVADIDRSKDDEKNIEGILDQLHEYRFTFTYDSNNNIYYFDNVERVS